MQYGGNEFVKIGKDGSQWKDYVSLPDGVLPEPEILPYDKAKDDIATEEICQKVAPFFRLFLPDPRPDLQSDPAGQTQEKYRPGPARPGQALLKHVEFLIFFWKF
ncbi:hypothetical protein CRE_23738 [Caenorhabditis remanei]|uniref:Uncharacterized protein n=1 Tax=Caenorhabditis remanei TaxID=31234 RepID=E3NFV4_CAERE|nr:hypothetical protein CRE_23738 [Caenorhabditis remanei]